MRTEIREESGYFSVYVNGLRMVDRESFATRAIAVWQWWATWIA